MNNTNNNNILKSAKMLKSLFLNAFRAFVLIFFLGFNSCISTTPMFDSYTDYNYAGLSKLQISNSKRLKGVNLAFKQYLKEFDGVDTNLIVILNSTTYITAKSFGANIFFIKDFKLDKSYSFNSSNLNPSRIDSLISRDPYLIDLYNISFITNFIKENGIENIVRITEAENCAVGGSGIGSTRITVFDPNFNIIDSYYFDQQMFCTDIEYLESLDKKVRN